MTVSYQNEFLYKVVEDLGDKMYVKFEILGDDLKSNGVTQNMKQSFELKDQPAAAALDRVLTPLKLCVVADEKEDVVYVTSEKAAKQRGWKSIPLARADDAANPKSKTENPKSP